MERAKDLLESSFLSVKEIAFQVGLNDESHFVRDFKSTYGYSPALYRSHFKSNGAEDAQRTMETGMATNGNAAEQAPATTGPHRKTLVSCRRCTCWSTCFHA